MHRSITGFMLLFLAGHISAQDNGPTFQKKSPRAPGGPAPFESDFTTIAGTVGQIYSLAVSADGKRVGTVSGLPRLSATTYVRVVDVQSRRPVLEMRVPGRFYSISLSPDGKRAAIAGNSGELRLLEVDGGKTILSKKLEREARAAFSPDGKSLAVVAQDMAVEIREVPSFKELKRLTGDAGPMHQVVYSPDGTKLVAVGGEGAVRVWDAASGKLLSKLKTNSTADVKLLNFSPDGKSIVAEQLNEVKIWDSATGELKKSWEHPARSTPGIAYAPDGKSIVVAAPSGMRGSDISIRDPETGEEIGTMEGRAIMNRHPAFCDGGKMLVTVGQTELRFFDMTRRVLLDEKISLMELALAAAGDGSLLAQAVKDEGVILRDGRSGEMKARLKGHGDVVLSLAFSPDGKTLATGSADNSIKFWDTATAKERATLKSHSDWVTALDFSRDGKTLVSGSFDKSVRIWDAVSGKQLGEFEAHRSSIRAVALSPD